MDELIRFVGLTLRLPFYLAGLVLAIAFTTVYGGLSFVWFFLVLPLVWMLVGVPTAFFSISFRGRGGGTEQLKQKLGSDISRWEDDYKSHFVEFLNMYRSLNRWFLEGPG